MFTKPLVGASLHRPRKAACPWNRGLVFQNAAEIGIKLRRVARRLFHCLAGPFGGIPFTPITAMAAVSEGTPVETARVAVDADRKNRPCLIKK